MHNDVKGTITGFISGFIATGWLEFTKEILVAFAFGAIGALGGFIMTHKVIPFFKRKYEQYVKTNHKP